MKKEKIIKKVLAVVVIIFSWSCSRDLGNYNYQDVNDISISGLLEGGHHTNRIYTISFNDALELRPAITGTLSKGDTSQLEFKWTVDGEIVSRHSKMAYIANKKYGKLLADFHILDKQTDISKTYSFFIDVINPYKIGHYVLSKKANGDALLYCRSAVKSDSKFEEVLIPALNPLGKEPICIGSVRKYGASASDYYNQITLGVRHAQYPVAILDSREFIPTLLYNSSSYVGEDGFTFEPVALTYSPVLSDLIIYATNSNGKVHNLWKGAISQAHLYNDPLDYKVDPGNFAQPYSYIQVLASFYDSKNHRIRAVGRNATNPVAYYFERNWGNIKNINLTDGQEYLFGAEASNIDTSRFVYLTKEGNILRSFKMGVRSGTTYEASELVKIAETTVSNIADLSAIRYDISGRFWYIAIGKTIYRASVLGLDLQPYLTLPSSATGRITKFHIANGQIMAATYSDSNQKSSIYIYDSTGTNLLYSEHGLEQVVDLIVAL